MSLLNRNYIAILTSILLVGIYSYNFTAFGQSTPEETWKPFEDAEGEFSLEYPSSWTLEPENKFSQADVSIIDNNFFQGSVVIQYNIKEEITQFVEGDNQKDIEDAFIIAYPAMLPSFSSSFESFNQVEATDYDKYNIDGHKSPSTIFSGKLSGIELAGWMVSTMIGDKLFFLTYLATPDQFDPNFPTVERILESIKILDD